MPGQQQRPLDQPDLLSQSEPGRQEQLELPAEQPEPPRPARESDGWQILSYMLGGMILYGGIGWLVSHFTGIAILFPLGMILGIGLSVAMIIFRFTRT
jgi:ATP synthase protein I